MSYLEELAEDARYTPEYQELYKKRKETIEQVFADAKALYALQRLGSGHKLGEA